LASSVDATLRFVDFASQQAFPPFSPSDTVLAKQLPGGSFMLSRRHLLRDFAAGTSTLALYAAIAPASRALAAAPDGEGAKLMALLDQFFLEDLKRSPETATDLGQDKGELAYLKAKLQDRSAAGRKADLDTDKDQLKRLKALNRKAMTGIDAVSYDCVDYVLSQQIELRSKFPYGSPDEGSPYAVSQLTGSYQSVPTFLDTKHSVENAADADAYLARLDAFAGELDADTESFKRDSGQGVLPAGFLLDTTLHQLEALQAKPEDSTLVSSLARRTKTIPGDYGAKAAKLYAGKIAPALERQIAAVKAARAKATEDAGVWHVKDGEGWYQMGLAISTTTTLSPEEIHRIGQEQGKEIAARMDSILKAQGYSKGTVGERVQALHKDPSFFYPNDDAGKEQAIADIQAKLDNVVSLLPKFFHQLPKAKAVVKRVPKLIEEGQALAYYESPALDGSRPGTIWFNFADSREWPKWATSTTLYHEGMPGHHLQGSIAQETPGLPKYRANMFLSGYGEGWALYAEQLADELGVYDNDPLGRVAYLNAQLFRAGRMVVDSGLHHKRWTRDQAVQYMVDLTGNARSGMQREVDRYCVWPGQACSYKVGHTQWVTLREKAQKELGAKYDIRDFHQVGLQAGVMPLDVLGRVIDDYIKVKKV
jgi:uncharacterized protein (DUF885 family)